MVKFRNAISNNKMAFTNNGAVTLSSSGDPNLDLFFLIGSARGKNITPQFKASHDVDPSLTASIALWARDIRGGAGERELFRQYLRWVEANHPILACDIINSGKIQEVGRWDDYLVFTDEGLRNIAFKQISRGFQNPNTVGLVAKWMPRQGRIANELGKWFGLSPRNWRKMVVASTHVVEQQMCAKEWEKINFSQVASVAAARYQKAFSRHAPEQYNAYRQSLVSKEDEKVKINASAVYPYDVLKSLAYGDETVAQAQWEALPDYIGDSGNRILPLLDVSGSMGAPVPGTTITMMDVCVSIGLYIATRQQGDFNRVLMNFSDRSEIVHLKKKTLRGMVQETVGMHWGMNTNLNAAFQNLLAFGRANQVPNEEMPNMIMIISDMEFDRCGSMTNMQNIEQHYAASGYTLPKVVFWCLNGRPGNSPVSYNKDGVALVSGFSPSLIKTVLGGKKFNPRDIMLDTVNVPRYQIGCGTLGYQYDMDK